MNTFTISKNLNKNKIFILQKSELEKRLDPFFYVPELLELEKKILAKKPKKLRDYVVSIASGSTPKRAEEEKYYSDKENGIPFLRVQNLSATGILKLEKVKYINAETHNGLLKRSQVSEGDLLVKITGVGRMAVASVAPKNFIGNINQHVCVIKTKNRKVSETLASFLNSDIGETLASRRSTGGTRPALDYPALLSIPIIEDERILTIKKELVKQKTANEQKAENLLASIDTYLLKELGIDLPKKQENTLKSRMFVRSIKDISGSRFDPYFNNDDFNIFFERLYKSKYPLISFKSISSISSGAIIHTSKYLTNGIPLIRIQNIVTNGIIFKNLKYISEDTFYKNESAQLKKGELLFGMSGTIGRVAIVQNDIPKCILNQRIAKVEINNKINNVFIQAVLNSQIGLKQFLRIGTGGIQINIGISDIENLKIPLPNYDKQTEIASYINSIRKQAQALKDKTKELIINSNKEIESILLN